MFEDMNDRIRNYVEPLIFIVFLGFLWEWGVKAFDVRSYLLPPLSDVFRVWWDQKTMLFEHGMITLVEVVVGFAFAVIGGVILAFGIFYVPTLRRTVYPLVTALQSIPKVAIAPLMIVWFGYGLTSKFVMAFLFAFFPIVIATLGGLSSTPLNLIEHFQALKASSWETIWRLRVPSALPSFIDGCKIAVPLSMIGAIVGEFVGSQNGLGYVILITSSTAQTALMFAALITIAVISMAMFGVLNLVGRFVWWRAV
jgi:NitT/TauT family transport system permease protein